MHPLGQAIPRQAALCDALPKAFVALPKVSLKPLHSYLPATQEDLRALHQKEETLISWLGNATGMHDVSVVLFYHCALEKAYIFGGTKVVAGITMNMYFAYWPDLLSWTKLAFVGDLSSFLEDCKTGGLRDHEFEPARKSSMSSLIPDGHRQRVMSRGSPCSNSLAELSKTLGWLLRGTKLPLSCCDKAPTPQQQVAPLLRVPREIRNMIYAYQLHDTMPLHIRMYPGPAQHTLQDTLLSWPTERSRFCFTVLLTGGTLSLSAIPLICKKVNTEFSEEIASFSRKTKGRRTLLLPTLSAWPSKDQLEEDLRDITELEVVVCFRTVTRADNDSISSYMEISLKSRSDNCLGNAIYMVKNELPSMVRLTKLYCVFDHSQLPTPPTARFYRSIKVPVEQGHDNVDLKFYVLQGFQNSPHLRVLELRPDCYLSAVAFIRPTPLELVAAVMKFHTQGQQLIEHMMLQGRYGPSLLPIECEVVDRVLKMDGGGCSIGRVLP